jgi:hypothetical protein
LLISCGAALMNVRLALRALGYEPQMRVLPDPARPALPAVAGVDPLGPAAGKSPQGRRAGRGLPA